MEHRYACRFKLFALLYSPLYPYLFDIGIVLAGFDRLYKFLWKIYLKGLRKQVEMLFNRNRLDTRYDRHIYTSFVRFVYKLKVFLIIEKHLRYYIISPRLYLFFEARQV